MMTSNVKNAIHLQRLGITRMKSRTRGSSYHVGTIILKKDFNQRYEPKVMRVRKWHCLGTILGLGGIVVRDNIASIVMFKSHKPWKEHNILMTCLNLAI